MTTAQSTGALRVAHDASENLVLPEQAEYRADLADRLFACFVALAIVTVYTPLRTLHSLFTWTLIALLLLAALAWIFRGLFAIGKRQWTRRLIAVSGWTLCLTLALYTYLSDILYLVI